MHVIIALISLLISFTYHASNFDNNNITKIYVVLTQFACFFYFHFVLIHILFSIAGICDILIVTHNIRLI